MRSANDSVPLTYAVSGQWPDAALDSNAPVSAIVAQALAKRISEAVAASGVSLREVGRLAGVSSSTMTRLVGGQVLCDIGTLARLEAALDADLWPGRAARSRPIGSAVEEASISHAGNQAADQ